VTPERWMMGQVLSDCRGQGSKDPGVQHHTLIFSCHCHGCLSLIIYVPPLPPSFFSHPIVSLAKIILSFSVPSFLHFLFLPDFYSDFYSIFSKATSVSTSVHFVSSFLPFFRVGNNHQ